MGHMSNCNDCIQTRAHSLSHAISLNIADDGIHPSQAAPLTATACLPARRPHGTPVRHQSAMSTRCPLYRAPGRCSGVVHGRNITLCLGDITYCTSLHFDRGRHPLAAQSAQQGRDAENNAGRHSYVFGFIQPSRGSKIDGSWDPCMQQKAGYARLKSAGVFPGPDTTIRPAAHMPAAGALPTASSQRSSPAVKTSVDMSYLSHGLVWVSAGLTLASFIPSLLAGADRSAAALPPPAQVPIASAAAWLVRPGQLKGRPFRWDQTDCRTSPTASPRHAFVLRAIGSL